MLLVTHPDVAVQATNLNPTMSFIDDLKQFFGLGAAPNATAPLPPPVAAPVQSTETNAPVAPVVTAPSAPAPAPTSGMPPTPQQRDVLYGFIVEKLAPYTNEKDGLPTGLRLWLLTDGPDDEDRLSVALFANQPGRFREELARHLANHYIQLAPDWSFAYQFVRDALPAECTYQQGRLGLEVLHPATNEQALRARLRTLTGQTFEVSYVLDPTVKTDYCIGRAQQAETASGRVRTNDIAFLDADDPGFDPQRGDPNLSVSRQHASIHYDAASRRYRLVADAGGLPANGNKTKILRADNTVERADLPGVGYVLNSGDQIELGGDAKLVLEIE